MDYKVTTYDPTTGIMTFGIPAVPKILTGLDKLVQIVVLSFLSNPGKNILTPNEGSGFRADIGQYNVTDPSGSDIKALAIQRTSAVQLEVISRQDPNSGTPDERLKSLILRDFAYDSDTSTALLRVQIIAESGATTDVLV